MRLSFWSYHERIQDAPILDASRRVSSAICSSAGCRWCMGKMFRAAAHLSLRRALRAYRAIFSRKSIVIARVSARVSHLHAALKKQPLTLVLTAPDEYRLQFLARYAIIIVSSSTVTYICITEECASDKCAEIAAFFSRRCSTCSRTTKMSRTCGTTGKSEMPVKRMRFRT